MVGEPAPRNYTLEEILSEKEVHHIIHQTIGDDVPWALVEAEVKPAIDGLAGFLGDHIRSTMCVKAEGDVKKVHLFIKLIPLMNKPKAEFINKSNYYRREMFIYKLFEEIAVQDDPNPWCSKAYLYSDTMLVMPDLAVDGYAPRHFLETLDLQHVLLAAASVARFHAAFSNYEAKKTIDEKRPYSTYKEYTELLTEPTFCDSPWLQCCAKLTVDFLNAFSTKFNGTIQNLESKLRKLYLEACDSLRQHQDTLNVLIHKDLWINNILFKYKDNTPTNAMLIDFQCLRYGPPAFDLMVFLYTTTSRDFRERHEREILLHYYMIFTANLDMFSKQRLEQLGYNEKTFLSWCERSRMFGAFEAIGIFPMILMDPKCAQKTFDDPDTYQKYLNEDRSEPVIAYARKYNVYKERQLEVAEEFVERYVLHSL